MKQVIHLNNSPKLPYWHDDELNSYITSIQLQVAELVTYKFKYLKLKEEIKDINKVLDKQERRIRTEITKIQNEETRL